MATAKRSSKSRSSTRTNQASAESSIEAQLTSFIHKFEPKVAVLIRQCRTELRKLLPTAVEIVGLSFYYGSSLPDPSNLLLGSGKQNRFIRLPSVEQLHFPAVVQLVRTAAKQGKTPLPTAGEGYTVIKSVSAKQRPRRKN